MSFEITTAFVKQYGSNVFHLAQQKGARLRKAVRVEDQKGEDAFYDAIGSVEPRKRTTRHADTPLISTPHSRRRVTLVTYDWADLIDKPDKVRTLIDPTNPYAQAGAWAMGRAIDDELIAAATGSAATGVDGGTSVALPAGQKIAVDYGGSAAGLTIGKLIKAKEILLANEVDTETIPLFIAVTAKQLTNLLSTTEVTSSDYNTVKALVKGDLNTFMGFEFIHTERLTKDSGDDRQVLAWAKDGLLLAIGSEPRPDIGPRRDKNNSIQVFYSMDIGATRMEEEKMVEIACQES